MAHISLDIFLRVTFEWHSNSLPIPIQKVMSGLQSYLLEKKQSPDGYDSLRYFLDGSGPQVGSCK